MCDVLMELYRKVYDESFSYGQFENRVKLQKAVYLIENMGVRVGDYGFSWDKHGPYSLALDYDAGVCGNKKEEVSFSEYAELCIKRLKECIKAQFTYSCVNWMECIASLHYLKVIERIDADSVIDELQKRKPYLSDDAANKKAFEWAERIIRIGT